MTFHGELKPYQIDAVQKMVEKKRVLVAYEMGLGKTPMTIAALEKLRDSQELTGTILILCLASLKYQWKAELKTFAKTEALVIDGTPKVRALQYSRIKAFRYVIMNYEQVVNDWETIKGYNFDAVVCDEATAIKGFRAKRAKKVKELSKKIPIRYALTGTPIENGKPEELYSIMQFVDPMVLGRFDLFDQAFIVRNNFGGVQRYRNLDVFHRRISSSVVRKSQKDEDVRPYLPEMTIREPIIVPLDTVSKKLYNFIAQDLLKLLEEAVDLLGAPFSLSALYGFDTSNSDREKNFTGFIMSRIVALRMLGSHPQLLLTSATEYREKLRTGKGRGGQYLAELDDEVHFRSYLGGDERKFKSPKMDATMSYALEHLSIDPSYKLVIFSSYVWCVDEFVSRFSKKGILATPYTGRMDAKQKEASKVSFQTDPDVRVLVSSDAGGYGVNLPEANLLINFDQPWSSGLAEQRNSRINRASSKWATIAVQDFLVENSIEQRQYAMLSQKRSVANAVLDGKGINAKGGVDLTVGSLLSFLRTRP
jgi:SNF2 family DNA or RNA helicase